MRDSIGVLDRQMRFGPIEHSAVALLRRRRSTSNERESFERFGPAAPEERSGVGTSATRRGTESVDATRRLL